MTPDQTDHFRTGVLSFWEEPAAGGAEVPVSSWLFADAVQNFRKVRRTARFIFLGPSPDPDLEQDQLHLQPSTGCDQ